MTNGILTIVLSVCLVVGIASIFIDIGYRRGQIDVLTNKIEYKLITMPDSTKVWERIGEKE
jgi:hypothetical protein